MILTNRHGLPQALVDAVKNDPYDNGGAWRSVTQLISPPRQVVLKKRHDHEIQVDVAELLFALYGQIVHQILQRANTRDLVEERLFTERAGKKISGGYDVLQLQEGKLIDWKFSTVWKAVGGDNHDWVAQLNLLALLCRLQLGVEIRTLEIILLMRDHSKPRARREPSYPQLPVQRIPITLWPQAQQEAYLDERVQMHLEAEEKLPLCSREDKWQADDIWAVIRKQHRTAIKNGLRSSREEAEDICSRNPKVEVQHRPGECKRCVDYCQASAFCQQFKEESIGYKRKPGNGFRSQDVQSKDAGEPAQGSPGKTLWHPDASEQSGSHARVVRGGSQ